MIQDTLFEVINIMLPLWQKNELMRTLYILDFVIFFFFGASSPSDDYMT